MPKLDSVTDLYALAGTAESASFLSVRLSFCSATTGFGLNTLPVPSACLTRLSERTTAPVSACTSVRSDPLPLSEITS